MSTAEAPPEAPTMSEPAKVAPRPVSGTQPRRLPPYAVILHNDDLNSMGFVIETLRRVFGYSAVRSFRLMMRAHRDGKAAVWTGQKEHAEFKADQIRSRGADPTMRHRGAGPLGVSIEPLPGA